MAHSWYGLGAISAAGTFGSDRIFYRPEMLSEFVKFLFRFVIRLSNRNARKGKAPGA
jgi:hypothetical protein